MSIRRKGLLTNAVKGAALVGVLAAASWVGLATRARAVAPANSSPVPATAASAAAADVAGNQVSAVQPDAPGGSALTTSNANPQSTEAVVLTVFPTGFDPAQITLPSGDYVLAVYNRSGIREITWQLHRENGERLHEVRTPRRNPDWMKRTYLPQGVYLLTAENQPEWRCRITVTSR